QAQQQTREPCGMDPMLTASAGLVLKNSDVRKAMLPIGVSLLPVSDVLPFVGQKKVEQPTALRPYFYQPHADGLVNDGINQVTTSATFACNEPNGGDSRREKYKWPLIGLGLWQAFKLFGKAGGGSA